jgi:hypothetical protein
MSGSWKVTDDDGYTYTCHSIGIGGNCGLDCPVLQGGECDSEEMNDWKAQDDGMLPLWRAAER